MDFTKIKENLISLGYEVSTFSSAKEASEYLDKEIDKKTVGFGGSMTLKDIGLFETLSTHNDVNWHWAIPEGTTAAEIYTKVQTCDVYLLSANGISEKGEIINIDGTCNRISASLFGHEKVYFIVGRNKIAEDFDSALYRTRNIAAPLNAKRLNKKTPCVVDLKCHDCKSPDRICHGLSVLWCKPGNGKYEVVLVDEDLGY